MRASSDSCNNASLLTRYACPIPFHAVRTRFLGNIATPTLDASPVQTIKRLWGGELPEFNDMAAVNELFEALMRLWNELALYVVKSIRTNGSVS